MIAFTRSLRSDTDFFLLDRCMSGPTLSHAVLCTPDIKSAKHVLKRLLKKQGCPLRRPISNMLGPMPPRTVMSCRQSNTAPIKVSTTAWRILIYPYADDSG